MFPKNEKSECSRTKNNNHIPKLMMGTLTCYFVVLILYIAVNNFEPYWDNYLTSTKQWIKCLAQRHNTVTAVSLELAHFYFQSYTLPTEPLCSTRPDINW